MAGFVDDDTIRATAARFPTPVQVPIVQAEPDDEQGETTPAACAPRKPRTSRRHTDNVGADS